MASDKMPWDGYLADWDIAAMNHYYVDGVRHLFVGMTRDGRFIKAESSREVSVWIALRAAAMRVNEDAADD